MLAGGLNPGNVAEAIRVTGAPIVDVSSGVESAPGVKDPGLIRKFIEAAKRAGSMLIETENIPELLGQVAGMISDRATRRVSRGMRARN